jgi:predicted nucleotidyltransferase
VTQADREVAVELKRRLVRAARGHLRRMIVFGSRAQGRAEPDSDLDVAALVDRLTPTLESAMDDEAYRLMWDRDFRPIVSLKVFAEGDFEQAVQEGYSFYRNVESQGEAV